MGMGMGMSMGIGNVCMFNGDGYVQKPIINWFKRWYIDVDLIKKRFMVFGESRSPMVKIGNSNWIFARLHRLFALLLSRCISFECILSRRNSTIPPKKKHATDWKRAKKVLHIIRFE